MKRFLLALFLAVSALPASALLSEKAEISLLTCQPGREIYGTFGHSALHVRDTTQGIDLVFNYGIFSFDADAFVYKFIKGETYYLLGVESFDDFLWSYACRNIGVFSQELNLTHTEKERLFSALMENALPKNRIYLYNFFYDNCATRLRDIVDRTIEGSIVYIELPKQTYRELIELFAGKDTWLKFGIDILVGAPADEPATTYGQLFLPYFLRDDYALNAVIRSNTVQKLVSSQKQLIPNGARPASGGITPLMAMWGLFAIVLAVSIIGVLKKKPFVWIDFALFLPAGLIGFAVVFVEFFSIHPAVLPNYNVLWLNPLQFVFACLLLIKPLRSKLLIYHYFNIFLIVLACVLSIKFQVFNAAFYPLMLALALRSGVNVYHASLRA